MDYKKIYDCLVEKAKVRGLDKSQHEGYFEIHHIIPRCLGGDNSEENLVMLTAREHVIAHRLLWKNYPNNYSLMWAYTRTVNSHKKILTSREVEKAKLAKSLYMSNRVVTQETRDKISATLTGHKRTVESVEKGRVTATGMKRSDETKENLRAARKRLLDSGWVVPDEAKKKIGDFFRGRPISEEHKRKISESTKGTVRPPHIGVATSLYQKSLHPWEKSSVKARKARFDVWINADKYYDLWKTHGCVGSWAFSTIASREDDTKYKTYHFDTIVENFRDGWVPSQDENWLDFKSNKGG